MVPDNALDSLRSIVQVSFTEKVGLGLVVEEAPAHEEVERFRIFGLDSLHMRSLARHDPIHLFQEPHVLVVEGAGFACKGLYPLSQASRGALDGVVLAFQTFCFSG